MKLRSFFSIIAVTFLFLTGCQWDNNDTNRDDGTPVDETRNTRDGQTNDGITQNVENKDRFKTNDRRDTDRDQERYDVSNEAADRILEEVDEIGQAYVLTSKKNAYVAATLRGSDRSSDDRRNKNDRDRQGNMTNDNATDNNVRADDRSKGERPSTGDASDNRDGEMANNSDNNRGDEITDDVKKKIKDIVKDTDKNIDKVYVSTSPDFFDLTNDFANDVQDGQPIEGFFDQIGNMIERVFPQNKR